MAKTTFVPLPAIFTTPPWVTPDERTTLPEEREFVPVNPD
jgi:hypothetical protein